MKITFIKKSLPGGLKTISIIYYIATIFSFIIAILAFTESSIFGKIPEFSSKISNPTLAFAVLGILFIFLSIFSFLVALGLQNKSNKARLALIIFCIINIIGGIISISKGSYISSINLLFNTTVASYLIFNRKVKEEFKSKSRKNNSTLLLQTK